MDRKVELPSGGWATLRDPMTVTNRERKPLLAEMARVEDLKDVPEGQQVLDRVSIAEMYLRILVKAWSFTYPIPASSPDSLEDIPSLDYDFLCLRVQDKESAIFLDTSEPPDPKDQNGSHPNSGNSGMDSSTTTSTHATISLPNSASTA